MQIESPGVDVPDAGTPSDDGVYTARDLRPFHRRFRVWIVAFAVVVVVAVVIGLLVMPRAKKAVEGATVLGVAVGGLQESALRDRVDGPVAARLLQSVQVSASSDTFGLTPKDAGVTLDGAATVDAVMAATAKGTVVEPVLAADLSALAKQLTKHKLAAVEPTAKYAAPKAGVLDAKGNTSYTASSRGVTVKAGTPGWSVDGPKAAAEYVDAVRAGRTQVSLPTVTDEPEGVIADQLIGTFTTYHGCCAPRVTNIHRIADLIDGQVIKPGATFSLDRTAGRRTSANGFVPAPAIVEGELEDQFGGGVSQFSTTLYNAAWFSGLPIPAHQPHSKYITRYPPGREATLDWQAIDNRITNDTDAPVVIRASYTGTSLTVSLYGHTGDRKVVSTTGPRSPRGDEGGFAVSVTRKVYDSDKLTKTDTTHWTYTGLD